MSLFYLDSTPSPLPKPPQQKQTNKPNCDYLFIFAGIKLLRGKKKIDCGFFPTNRCGTDFSVQSPKENPGVC
jgi:hypothetical protein